jgi:hypothetical protein
MILSGWKRSAMRRANRRIADKGMFGDAYR